MKKKGHEAPKLFGMLMEAYSRDVKQGAFYLRKRICVATVHRWTWFYGLMSESDAKHLMALQK
jgi:hypothetical protein